MEGLPEAFASQHKYPQWQCGKYMNKEKKQNKNCPRDCARDCNRNNQKVNLSSFSSQ